MPILAGFNSGEIRSLRSSRRRRRPMRPPMRQRSASATPISPRLSEALSGERYGREHARGDARRALWLDRRAAGREADRAGVPSFLYYFDHGYPAADELGPARLSRRRNAVCLRHDRQDAAAGRKCRRRRPKRSCRTRCSTTGPASRAPACRARRPAAWPAYGTSAPTWPSRTRRAPKTHLLPGMYELNEQVVCRRRAKGGIPWNWNVGVVSPPLPARGAMPMIDGDMQAFALTLDKFLEHAAKWHPRAEVVTAREGGRSTRRLRRTRSSAAGRSRPCCAGFGVGLGRSRRDAGLEHAGACRSWYAIMGMGAVCHTLNPRLTARSSRRWSLQSDARMLIASADLAAAGAQDRRRRAVDRAHAADRRRSDVADVGRAPRSLRARAADRAALATTSIWGGFDETAPCGLCFTSGTTGAPKGVTYTHRSSFLHTLRLLQADVHGDAARDSVLTVVPMFHANAWGLPFAAPAAGAKLVLPGPPGRWREPRATDQRARR